MFRSLTAMLVILFAVPLAGAQAIDQPDTEGGRYILRKVESGLMRVDRETGSTSFCRKRDNTWTCELVADDRAALEDEIARLAGDNSELAREIGRLKKRIARLESGAPAMEPETPRSQGEDGEKEAPYLDLPSDEEIDQVMQTFQMMMRRFFDMVRGLREDFDQDRT